MATLKKLASQFDQGAQPILTPMDFEYQKRTQQHQSAVAKNDAIMAARYNLVLRAAELEKQSKLESAAQKEQYRTSVRRVTKRYVPVRASTRGNGWSTQQQNPKGSRMVSKSPNTAALDDGEVNRAVLSMYFQATNPPWVGRVDQMLSKYQGREQNLFRSVAQGRTPQELFPSGSTVTESPPQPTVQRPRSNPLPPPSSSPMNNSVLRPKPSFGTMGGSKPSHRPTPSGGQLRQVPSAGQLRQVPSAGQLLRPTPSGGVLRPTPSGGLSPNGTPLRTSPSAGNLRPSPSFTSRPVARTEPALSDAGGMGPKSNANPRASWRNPRLIFSTRFGLGNTPTPIFAGGYGKGNGKIVTEPETPGWRRRTMNRVSVFGSRLAAIRGEAARLQAQSAVKFNQANSTLKGVKDSPFMQFDRKKKVKDEERQAKQEKKERERQQQQEKQERERQQQQERERQQQQERERQQQQERERQQQRERERQQQRERKQQQQAAKKEANERSKQRRSGEGRRRHSLSRHRKGSRARKTTLGGSSYVSSPFAEKRSKIPPRGRPYRTLRPTRKIELEDSSTSSEESLEGVRRRASTGAARVVRANTGTKPGTDLPVGDQEVMEDILRSFYEVYAPEKLPSLTATLTAFQGNESDLFESLEVQYGVRFGANGYAELEPEEIELQTNLTEFLEVTDDPSTRVDAPVKANKLMKRYTIRNLANALYTRYQALPNGWKDKLVAEL